MFFAERFCRWKHGSLVTRRGNFSPRNCPCRFWPRRNFTAANSSPRWIVNIRETYSTFVDFSSAADSQRRSSSVLSATSPATIGRCMRFCFRATKICRLPLKTICGLDQESGDIGDVAAGPQQIEKGIARRTNGKPASIPAWLGCERTRLAVDEMPSSVTVAGAPVETPEPWQAQEVQSKQVRSTGRGTSCKTCGII